MSANTVFLVRHGENRANLTRQFSHRKIDYPLTPRGRLQARQTAAYLARFPIHAVYTSPLKRAVETASFIAALHCLRVQICEHFREVDVGKLEDQPPTDANWALHDHIFSAWYAGDDTVSFPGGEDYLHLWARMQDGLRLATRSIDGRALVIVGHGGLFNATIKDLCPEIDIRQLLAKDYPNGAVSEIVLRTGDGYLRAELQRWADITQLYGEATSYPLPQEIHP